MKILKLLCAASMTLAVLPLAMASQSGFTQKDLEQMVSELDAVIPHHPELRYPIECKLEENEEINAYATVKASATKGEKPQTKMVVFSGLAKAAKYDLRLIRAVVAHELAHLSKGHMLVGFKPTDLDLIYTRQLEYEADIIGAAALEKTGKYSRKDMVDMLMFLDADSKNVPKTNKLLGDHADCKRRAAEVAENPNVLKSQIAFELGEAYMDTRNYEQAMRAFDRAIEREPKLIEAYTNSALAALQAYYYMLPVEWQENNYRPDFGPLLGLPAASRLVEIDDTVRRYYANALRRIQKMIEVTKGDLRSQEIAGLALILDPDGKADSIRSGLEILDRALGIAVAPADRLRISNNIALGYQRQGNTKTAIEKMMSAQKGTSVYNAALCQNLGQQDFPETLKSEAPLAAGMLAAYLTNTAKDDEGSKAYDKAASTYNAICNKFNLKKVDVSPKPVYLCRVFTINVDGKEYSLFQSGADLIGDLGKPEKVLGYADDQPDMCEASWNNQKLLVICQRNEALRVTSYFPGAFALIKPKDVSVKRSFKIFVGMTKAELSKILNVDSAPKRSFVRLGTLEDWTYFAGLNFGVCIKDDKVVGITATPSA